MIHNTTVKQCRLCKTHTENAEYVSGISGWRCDECAMQATGAFDVATLRTQIPLLEFNNES